MLKAIKLGDESRCLSPPNPWVGCVIVSKDGLIVGEGATQKVGEAHAEIVALGQAGESAQGSTVYVTLEPCCHYGRTPPCVEALIRSKVSKVVIALLDPDPIVHTKGVQRLREAGIEVVIGLGQQEAEQSLRPYLFQRSNHRPFILAKCACSLDGRIAASDKSSKWISSEAARLDAHLLRAQSQAILIGVGTAIEDLPKLNVRIPSIANRPLRVVLDSRGKLPVAGPLFDLSLAKTLVITTAQTSFEKINEWQNAGVSVEVVTATNDGLVNLHEALRVLNDKGMIQVLCEGGSSLLGAFLNEHLVDMLVAYVSPCLLGDKGIPLVQGMPISNIKDAYPLELEGCLALDGTVRMDYSIKSKKLFK
ncbi:MAG: bifunctional diaminohydroxyphosphoribosylaminopyrimidine deaminase/5-amino-6-(5-phosphoribosylamino)uracil reductase RibD [Parachlamydiaceae bacterium]